MMPRMLGTLVDGLPLQWLQTGDAPIADVAVDSRDVRPGTLFFARQGWFVDAHQFIPAALAAGASALIVTRADGVPADCPVPVLLSHAEDRDLGLIADRFYGHPTDDIKVVGITGTNGKTSTAWLTAWWLQQCGHRPAIIGTVGHWFDGTLTPTRNTTPDGLFIHRYAYTCKNAGATALVMEVSSHGLHLGRIAGVSFDAVGFTNLTEDHLDYHGSMDAYRQAKWLLFHDVCAFSRERGKQPVAVVHVGSDEGRRLSKSLRHRHGCTEVAVNPTDDQPADIAVHLHA